MFSANISLKLSMLKCTLLHFGKVCGPCFRIVVPLPHFPHWYAIILVCIAVWQCAMLWMISVLTFIKYTFFIRHLAQGIVLKVTLV